jgi:hypothetical protein
MVGFVKAQKISSFAGGFLIIDKYLDDLCPEIISE